MKKTTDSIDEVEELLKAAQDDMLLKLSLSSHMARSSSSSLQPPPSSPFIDTDLDRRFEALKSIKPKSSQSGISTELTIDSEKKNPEKVVNNGVESDDLVARFAALKTSLPSYSSSSSSNFAANDQRQRHQLKDGGGTVTDNEVEELIKWAIDAARLDPSPPSDIEDNDDSHDEDHSDDDHSNDEDDDKVDAGKKSNRSK